MKAIILAGGRATRLPNSARDIPKALVRVGSKTIIEHQIDWMSRQGIYDIRLALGYMADQIINHLGRKYEYVIEKEPLGTGGAIKFASLDLTSNFLVVNGDIVTNLNINGLMESFQRSPFQNIVSLCQVGNPESFGLVKIDGARILEFFEKPDRGLIESQPAYFINAGVYILSPDIFKNIEPKSFLIEKEIFPILAKEGRLGGFLHQGFWQDLGTEERLARVRKMVEERIIRL
ncbi:MAG: nucleotidyltransferase family protein [Candidatus Nealsonbacteria bacterium]|nr:nucleotidyltransferase family protein [Candidatus Nealsonbacteria bacterium]